MVGLGWWGGGVVFVIPQSQKNFDFHAREVKCFCLAGFLADFFFKKKCVQKRDFGGVFMCFFCTGSSSGPPSPSPWPGPYVQLFKRLLKQIFMFFTKNFLSLGGIVVGVQPYISTNHMGRGKYSPRLMRRHAKQLGWSTPSGCGVVLALSFHAITSPRFG